MRYLHRIRVEGTSEAADRLRVLLHKAGYLLVPDTSAGYTVTVQDGEHLSLDSVDSDLERGILRNLHELDARFPGCGSVFVTRAGGNQDPDAAVLTVPKDIHEGVAIAMLRAIDQASEQVRASEEANAEEARAAEIHAAEQTRIAEAWKAGQARVADAHAAELLRIAEHAKVTEQARVSEQMKAAEQAHVAEQARIERAWEAEQSRIERAWAAEQTRAELARAKKRPWWRFGIGLLCLAVASQASAQQPPPFQVLDANTGGVTNNRVFVGLFAPSGSGAVAVALPTALGSSGGFKVDLTGVFGDIPVNLVTVGGAAVSLGQTIAGESMPVVLASDTGLPTGTNSIGQVTANAGTNLNTSALLTTTAHDAAFGTAGTPDAQIRSVQGAASMRPVDIAQRAATSTLTNVSDTASSTTCLASNTARLSAMFFNDSTAIVYLKFGATASTTSYTVKVQPDGFYTVQGGYNGIVDCIWASDASGAARVTELTQ